MRLIAFCGYAGSGKSTAAALTGLPVRSWAEPIRRAALALDPYVYEPMRGNVRLSTWVEWLGWDKLKREFLEVRRLLQRLGTEAGRDIHGPDCWVKLANLEEDGAFADTRFPNEVAAFREAGGLIVWMSKFGVGPANEHASENSIGPEDCDFVLCNHGSREDLAVQVAAMLAHYGLRVLPTPDAAA